VSEVPARPLAASGAARWRAAGWDYLGIAGWLVLLTAVGAAGRGVTGAGTGPLPVATTDAVAFALTVLPVWAYLTAAEAGPAGAGWGKRRVGLRVVQQEGGRRPGWGRAALRNAVKLLPWQLAHVAVVRLALRPDQPVSLAVTCSLVLALVLPVASLAVAVRDPAHRALHDVVAGTRVVPAPPA
jgi:uncharacterized RDD family membrane protein YckC